MDYFIWHEGEILATFHLHENDREVCLDALREEYPDCKFTKELED